MNDEDWNAIRKDYFPSLNAKVHLKAAGGSPLNKLVYEEGIKYFNNLYEKGDLFWNDYFKNLENARELVSDYLNCKPHEIAFMPNTSSGMNICARLLDKGNIIYPESEFPSSIHIFKRLGYRCRKLKSQKDNSYDLSKIDSKKLQDTDYIIHSHVQYLTGFKQNLNDLGYLCQKNNILNMVNATQSFGAFNIDVIENNIDILVATGLKWLCGGYGAGILFIREKTLRGKNLPFSSWLSVKNKFNMDNENLDVINKTKFLDSFGGTPHFSSLLPLKGALQFIKKLGCGNLKKGISQISERISFLTYEFLEKIRPFNFNIITPLGNEFRSGIITLQHEKAKKIYDDLFTHQIYISLRNYPGSPKKSLLRFSFNYYNNLADISKTTEILKRYY